MLSQNDTGLRYRLFALLETLGMPSDEATIMAAGMVVGIKLSLRHPEYAQGLVHQLACDQPGEVWGMELLNVLPDILPIEILQEEADSVVVH